MNFKIKLICARIKQVLLDFYPNLKQKLYFSSFFVLIKNSTSWTMKTACNCSAYSTTKNDLNIPFIQHWQHQYFHFSSFAEYSGRIAYCCDIKKSNLSFHHVSSFVFFLMLLCFLSFLFPNLKEEMKIFLKGVLLLRIFLFICFVCCCFFLCDDKKPRWWK